MQRYEGGLNENGKEISEATGTRNKSWRGHRKSWCNMTQSHAVVVVDDNYDDVMMLVMLLPTSVKRRNKQKQTSKQAKQVDTSVTRVCTVVQTCGGDDSTLGLMTSVFPAEHVTCKGNQRRRMRRRGDCLTTDRLWLKALNLVPMRKNEKRNWVIARATIITFTLKKWKKYEKKMSIQHTNTNFF